MLRIGAVRYLNTKPLIFDLADRLPDCTVEYDLPSRLADRLAGGNLDIGLIPSVEFLRSHDVSILSDACIGCVGPVRSVRLLFRTPPSEVKSLALDEGSRTSAVLSQVLLNERFGCRPQLRPFPITASISSAQADAVLVIGDRAMNLDHSDIVEDWDLGQEWYSLTGLPFVFAMWVSPNSIATTDAVADRRYANALEMSRDAGLAAAAQLASRYHSEYGISADECLQYFKRHLQFRLGEDELRGLSLFREKSVQLGLLPAESNDLSLHPS